MANISRLSLRRIRTWLSISVVLLVLFAIGKFVFAGPSKEQIPDEFISARSDGAAISASIVGIYNEELTNLQKISEEDRQKKYLDALNLTLAGAQQNKEALGKSQELATELGKMANVASRFKSEDARNLVLEAVTSEINLVTHLITYNGYFNELLGNLQEKFSGTASQDRVGELIAKMNNEAQTIDSLNREFNDKIAEFDKKYR